MKRVFLFLLLSFLSISANAQTLQQSLMNMPYFNVNGNYGQTSYGTNSLEMFNSYLPQLFQMAGNLEEIFLTGPSNSSAQGSFLSLGESPPVSPPWDQLNSGFSSISDLIINGQSSSPLFNTLPVPQGTFFGIPAQ